MPTKVCTRPSPRTVAAVAMFATIAGLLITFVAGGPAAAGVPTPAHTVIVVMENHTYSEVVGAPYISSLVRAGANMTDAHGIRHPSQPNYLALWSGSTQGLTDDSCPHTFNTDNLGEQLLQAGKSTAIYSENLPTAGSLVCSASGGYARKHNPLVDFAATSGAATNKPYTAWPTNFDQLPTVSMVVPNLNNDMHDGTIAQGDTWLKTHVEPYVQWAQTHNSLLVLTFDEDDNTATNRIPTIFVGPMVKPGNYGETINHYSVLHTIEAAHGLPLLGVSAAPVTDIWAGTGSSSSPASSTPTTSAASPTTPAASTSASPSLSASPSVSASPSAPAGSSTPPSSSTASSSASPTPSPPPPARPLRGTFYYPWYPHAWTQNGMYPYTHYRPTAGFYDSTNQSLIAYQVAGMRYAGLDFAISSWWGQGSREDAVVPAELAAGSSGFKWSLYYEAEGTGNPTVAQIQSDLGYIASRYASNPAYLTVGGKPVLFVYGNGDSCSMVSRWTQANAGRFYVVLKVFAGYRTCADQPASWHQYGPASATDSQAGYSYAVSPGFWKANETSPRLARSETRWISNLKSMVASGAPWQLVTTWNEWGEGTAVEDATGWAQSGSYGAYIEDLHNILAPKLGLTHRPLVAAERALPLSASVCRCTFVATGGNSG